MYDVIFIYPKRCTISERWFIMAMIQCPECRTDVSDKAQSCGKCSFPIASLRTDGEIRIRMTDKKENYKGVGGINFTISNATNGNELWKGTGQETASFYLKEPTEIEISAKGFGYNMHGKIKINPQKCKTYQITAKSKYTLKEMLGIRTFTIGLVELDFLS
jgi:hypothetical protein